ncbi:uncharacterized protein LOC124606128 [Schistocerca americana]|uniref:uncharacterized protein LOC124606128 n=1 Tax=Schistocerca americana TaxID=7009 RepID=UPI001F4FB5AC|nr:uncharacterized protein LOC124606128 [Schistocerca americana]
MSVICKGAKVHFRSSRSARGSGVAPAAGKASGPVVQVQAEPRGATAGPTPVRPSARRRTCTARPAAMLSAADRAARVQPREAANSLFAPQPPAARMPAFTLFIRDCHRVAAHADKKRVQRGSARASASLVALQRCFPTGRRHLLRSARPPNAEAHTRLSREDATQWPALATPGASGRPVRRDGGGGGGGGGGGAAVAMAALDV